MPSLGVPIRWRQIICVNLNCGVRPTADVSAHCVPMRLQHRKLIVFRFGLFLWVLGICIRVSVIYSIGHSNYLEILWLKYVLKTYLLSMYWLLKKNFFRVFIVHLSSNTPVPCCLGHFNGRYPGNFFSKLSSTVGIPRSFFRTNLLLLPQRRFCGMARRSFCYPQEKLAFKRHGPDFN